MNHNFGRWKKWFTPINFLFYFIFILFFLIYFQSMNQNACNFYIVQRLQTLLHPGQGGHHTNLHASWLIVPWYIHYNTHHFFWRIFHSQVLSLLPFGKWSSSQSASNCNQIKWGWWNKPPLPPPFFCCIPSTITLVTKPNNN